MTRRARFSATVLDGHKGLAFELPFDPGARWGVSAVRLRAGRRGCRIRASVNAKSFETAVVARSKRFWVLVPDEMQDALGIGPGSMVRVSVEPLPPAGSRATS